MGHTIQRSNKPKTTYKMKFPTSPYFGMSRTMYLQTLANRWGDFGVSWNFKQPDGEIGFTKKRSVMILWQEQYAHPSECRLEKVMHREAMPREHFIEIDDEISQTADNKKDMTIKVCEEMGFEYAVYKSRKGYHISVIDLKRLFTKEKLIQFIGSDSGMKSTKATWSMEWTKHWKDETFIIKPIKISKNYVRFLLGLDIA